MIYIQKFRSSVNFFEFKVLPSQRQSESLTMYNVWVCLQKDYGWVLTAKCSCIAGLGSACSHLAALLFKIESACHLKLTEGISPTSVLFEWNKSKKSVQPAIIKLINFSRPRNHQLPKEIANKSLKRQNFSTKSPFLGTYPLTNDELKKVYQENQPLQFSQVLTRPVFMNIQTAMIDQQILPQKLKKQPYQKC